METLIPNRNCIIKHEFKATKTVNNGELVACKNTVEQIIIYQDEFNNHGQYKSTTRIVLDKYLLNDIIQYIDKIESEQIDMEYQDGFTF